MGSALKTCGSECGGARRELQRVRGKGAAGEERRGCVLRWRGPFSGSRARPAGRRAHEHALREAFAGGWRKVRGVQAHQLEPSKGPAPTRPDMFGLPLASRGTRAKSICAAAAIQAPSANGTGHSVRASWHRAPRNRHHVNLDAEEVFPHFPHSEAAPRPFPPGTSHPNHTRQRIMPLLCVNAQSGPPSARGCETLP